MFASAALSHTTSTALAGAYRRVGVETGVAAASPHELVTMLFEGFGAAIAEARNAMQRREVGVKCAAITRAVRIVDEGLKASLDAQAGGKLAEDLHALYGYVAIRLTEANLHNDVAALDECVALVEPVRSAWAAIGANAARAPAVQ